MTYNKHTQLASAWSLLTSFLRLYGLVALIGAPLIPIFLFIYLYGYGPLITFLRVAFFFTLFLSLALSWWRHFTDARRVLRTWPPAYVRKAWKRIYVKIFALFACVALVAKLSPHFLNDYLLHIPAHLIVYVAILYSLDRPLFLLLLVLDALLIFFLARVLRFPKRTLFRVGLFVWVYFCFAQIFFVAFKYGPTPTSCSKIVLQPGLRVLLSRSQIQALEGQEKSLPYDTVVSNDGRYLIASLKRIDFKPGALVKIDVERATVVGLLAVGDGQPGRMEFPEQLAIDPEQDELYALVYSPGHYRVLVVSGYGESLHKEGSIPLPGEPTYVFANLRDKNIFVPLTDKAGYKGVVIDTTSRQIVKKLPRETHSDANGQLVTTGEYEKVYQASFGPGDKLFEIDPSTYQTIRSKYLVWPLVSLVFDDKEQKLYAASPLTYSVFEIDPRTLERIASLSVRGGLSHVQLDQERRVLFVGSYAGTVQALDLTTKKSLWEFKAGRMLRNIRYDQQSRRLFVCSGCGIFEIDTLQYSSLGR